MLPQTMLESTNSGRINTGLKINRLDQGLNIYMCIYIYELSIYIKPLSKISNLLSLLSLIFKIGEHIPMLWDYYGY